MTSQSSVIFEPWKAPMCLIESTDNATGYRKPNSSKMRHSRRERREKKEGLRFSIVEETAKRLAAVNLPVVPVAIAGKYRTGKSYLMNRLSDLKGFSVGSSCDAETRGVWIWARRHPLHTDQALLLIDTEGLGDPNRDDDREHDAALFCLAVLLSTTLIYNDVGAITQSSFESLRFITDLTKHLENDTRARDSVSVSTGLGREKARSFPHLVWAARDFMLQLRRGDEEISADEYFEQMIQRGGDGSTTYHLRKAFPSRKCFCFPLPLPDVAKLADLIHTPDSAIEPGFVSVTKDFCDHVFQSSEPLWLDSEKTVPYSSTDFLKLVELYVEAIQNGRVPTIGTSLEATARINNEQALVTGLSAYETHSHKCLSALGGLPVPAATLFHVHQEAVNVATSLTQTRCLKFGQEQTLQSLTDMMKKMFSMRMEENNSAIRSQNQKLIDFYCGEYDDWMSMVSLPTSELTQIHSILRETVLDRFRCDCLMEAKNKSRMKLMERIQELYEQFQEENDFAKLRKNKKKKFALTAGGVALGTVVAIPAALSSTALIPAGLAFMAGKSAVKGVGSAANKIYDKMTEDEKALDAVKSMEDDLPFYPSIGKLGMIQKIKRKILKDDEDKTDRDSKSMPEVCEPLIT